MKFLTASLLSVLIVISVGLVQSQHAGDQSNIPAEEYVIYAAVIDNMFARDKASSDSQSKVKLLVIKDRTFNNTSAIRGEEEGRRVKQEFSSIISQETIDDYVAKNAKSYQLTKSFDLKLKYTLIPKEKIEQIFKSGPGGWGEFYMQFPDSGGLIALSRAGLDSGGNQALVYITHSCGGLCGSGNYLLLVKKDKGWVVRKKFTAWVS
jgi:hypothetical protein